MTSPVTDTKPATRSLLDSTRAPQITVSRVPTFVDDVTVRLIAAVVVAVGLLALATQQWWLYAVLFADFTLRAAGGPPMEPDRARRRRLAPAAPRRPEAAHAVCAQAVRGRDRRSHDRDHHRAVGCPLPHRGPGPHLSPRRRSPSS